MKIRRLSFSTCMFLILSFLAILCGCSSSHGKALDPLSSEFSWMDAQIEKDFLPYHEGITLEQLDVVCRNIELTQRFKVLSNTVYGPESKMKNLLERLCQLYDVPDVDFVYYAHDGFIIEPATNSLSPPILCGPIFTSAKHESILHALYFADWYFDPTSFNNRLFDWSLLSTLINKYCKKSHWEKKQTKAVWRGGLQGYIHDYSLNGFAKTPRGKTCILSLNHPDIIDAGVNWGIERPFIHDLVQSGIDPRKNSLSHKKQMKYKYIIDIDGHTCTYPGLQWKMLSNSTTIKQETPNKMWYFSQMIPWEHYIPVKEDLSDLVEKVTWCIDNDERAKTIAEQGRQLALRTMMPEHCLLYCYKALEKYASLQKFQPKRTYE